MEPVLIALVALACPVGMLVMGWCMVKGMRSNGRAGPVDVGDLRSEHRRIGAEIERLENGDRNGDSIPAAAETDRAFR